MRFINSFGKMDGWRIEPSRLSSSIQACRHLPSRLVDYL
jgi:hypothetical protein